MDPTTFYFSLTALILTVAQTALAVYSVRQSRGAR